MAIEPAPEDVDLVFDAPVEPVEDVQAPEETPDEDPVAVDGEPDDATDDPAPSRRRRGARRVPPAAPATTASGQVRVSGPPSLWDAPIIFRGRRLGTVPGTIQLPAGNQTIEIRAPGQPPVRRDVAVRAGQVTRVTVR